MMKFDDLDAMPEADMTPEQRELDAAELPSEEPRRYPDNLVDWGYRYVALLETNREGFHMMALTCWLTGRFDWKYSRDIELEFKRQYEKSHPRETVKTVAIFSMMPLGARVQWGQVSWLAAYYALILAGAVGIGLILYRLVSALFTAGVGR